MSVTVLQYAQLSNHVYRDSNQQIPGFTNCEWDFDKASGFYAGIYCSQKGRDVVVCYRGSDDLVQDWAGADLTMVLRLPPVNQIQRAIQFFNYVMSNWGSEGNVSVTGHSLGGALTQVVCAMSSTPGVTFNSPGMRQQLAKYRAAYAQQSNSTNKEQIINYRLQMDPVSQITGEHVGQLKTISDAPPGVAGHGLLAGASGPMATGSSHSIITMIAHLSRQQWAHRSPFEAGPVRAGTRTGSMAY